MKKIDYINIMERVLDAYSDEHIERFFNEVKENGISEHGFPRLTANIGILLCYNKKTHLKKIFREMMDFTCRSLSICKENMKNGGGNEFSVREICFCIKEIEKSGIFPKDDIEKWKNGIRKITPDACYKVYAKTPYDHIFNWALFAALSEFARKEMNLADESEFIETQLATQIKHIDKNGMYMDADTHPPMLYDFVPRMLFSLLLHMGYDGKYKKEIQSALDKSSMPSLLMQSSTGEFPFGGRSNQFLHNDAVMAALFEYYASKCYKENRPEKAETYKRAARLACDSLKGYLSNDRITHIKNRFDINSSFGCEAYAYFDKYMVTTASMLFVAATMCDDFIKEGIAPCEDDTSYSYITGEDFSKVFLKCGEYSLQIELSANPNYDASGIGRIHKRNVPSVICLSVPVGESLKYNTFTPNPHPMSLCAGFCEKGEKFYAWDETTKYRVIKTENTKNFSMCELECKFDNHKILKEIVTVKNDGIDIQLIGDGELLFMLPAIKTDGENVSDVVLNDNSLEVSYLGHKCTYKTNGKIFPTENIVSNRNGSYYVYESTEKNKLKIEIEIN